MQDIPKNLQDAVVFTEDQRFYEHTGVDFKRTFAAFANMIIKTVVGGDKEYGGSTISQQLIKNINGDITNRTIDVKIKEIIGSMNLERNYSKEQILESYLNYISLDNNIRGVQAGAKYYFNKDVSELTLNECAILAVISKSPSTYNPYKHPEKNDLRRKYALDKLLEFKKISQADHDAAYKEEYKLANPNAISSDKTVKPTKKYQSYFTDSVINEVIADLQKEYNYNEDHAKQLLYTSGWSVYTTMEIDTQNTLENFFANPANFNTKYVTNKTQAYMTIMDYDGNIVAVVGGKGPKEGDRILNRAMVSKRPAGSTIKPLAVYTPAFEHDLITWSMIMEDSAVQNKENKPDGELNWPNNYNKKYEGNISIIDALRVSKNTIPVRIVNALTPQVSFDFVHDKLGLKSLVGTGSHNNVNAASLALGDGGSTLTELTAAYQIFGNGGYYTAPKLYTKVVNASGEVILDTTKRAKTRVISPETAFIMNKGLWNVVDSGSGKNAKMDKWEVVGKTGTSNDRKDLLFMGLTPYYVGGIRYGFDDNDKTIDEKKDVGLDQIRVWKKVMELIHKGRNPAKFELDKTGVVEYEYCTESGMQANSGCPTKKIGYYKESNPLPVCSIHSYNGGPIVSSQPATSSTP